MAVFLTTEKATTRRVAKAEALKKRLADEGRWDGRHYYSRGGTLELPDGVQIKFKPKPIDEERINSHQAVWEKAIRSKFAALGVWEAAWDWDDLVNECRYEVLKCLRDRFDPVEALRPRPDGTKGREKWEDLKAADPDHCLFVTERGFVKRGLENFLWRTQYEFHPQQRGGQTGSYDLLLEAVHRERHGGLCVRPIMAAPGAAEDLEGLFDALEGASGDAEGAEAARLAYANLPASRREDLLDFLLARVNSETGVHLLPEESLQDALSTRSLQSAEDRRLCAPVSPEEEASCG